MAQMSSGATPPTPPAAAPRAAATLVLARDAPDGLEVLLSRRAERGDHNSGAWVFPGGIVDAGDRRARACCAGVDDAQASQQLGLPHDALDYYVAAVRECFEESGVLLATDAGGDLVRLDAQQGAALAAWRGLLHRNERTLSEMCAQFGLRLALDRLVYLSHWLTPLGRPKRYDTRFFIAEMPRLQTAAFDGTEMVEQLWVRPALALARAHELKLMTPTHKTLELVARHDTVAALMAWAREPRSVALIMPRVGTGAQGQRPVLPDEPAFEEIGRLDPAGHGHARYDLVPERPVRLSSRVIRVTANNGSLMTGPGTNTYLVGEGPLAVVDPGPDDEGHRSALLAAVAAAGPTSRPFWPRRRVRSAGSSPPTPTWTTRRPRTCSRRTPAPSSTDGCRSTPNGRTPASCRTSTSRGGRRLSCPATSRCRPFTRPGTRRTTCATGCCRSSCCSPATT